MFLTHGSEWCLVQTLEYTHVTGLHEGKIVRTAVTGKSEKYFFLIRPSLSVVTEACGDGSKERTGADFTVRMWATK